MGTQNQENQKQRWNHHKRDALGQFVTIEPTLYLLLINATTKAVVPPNQQGNDH